MNEDLKFDVIEGGRINLLQLRALFTLEGSRRSNNTIAFDDTPDRGAQGRATQQVEGKVVLNDE